MNRAKDFIKTVGLTEDDAAATKAAKIFTDKKGTEFKISLVAEHIIKAPDKATAEKYADKFRNTVYGEIMDTNIKGFDVIVDPDSYSFDVKVK